MTDRDLERPDQSSEIRRHERTILRPGRLEYPQSSRREGLLARLSTTRSRPARDPFTRVQDPQRLDLITSHPYDMSVDQQERNRAEIRELITSLQPGALDAGSREVLNNLINARTDAALAELDAARDERQAVADLLVGLAAEEGRALQTPL